MAFTIDHLDRLVLKVEDRAATIDFYTKAPGMQAVTFGDRKALKFGQQEISLHQRGHEWDPKAGSSNAGFRGPLFHRGRSHYEEVLRHLAQLSIHIEQGLIERMGAAGNCTRYISAIRMTI